MPYTVEMCFDEKSNKKIRELWNLLDQKNISNYMIASNMTPHITLTVFNQTNHKLVNDRLKNFAQEIEPSEISFSHIGFFPSDSEQGVVFLAPTITMDLLKFYRKFYDYFTDFIDEQVKYYLPNAWIPHCTIVLNISQAKVIKTIEEILSRYEPIEVKIKSINFVKYHPAEILSSFILE